MVAPHLNSGAGGSLAGRREQTAGMLSNLPHLVSSSGCHRSPWDGVGGGDTFLEIFTFFTRQLLTSLWAVGL